MKIGIVTINDNDNYGNRLQNYAVQEVLKEYIKNSDVITLKNTFDLNFKKNFLYRFCKFCLKKVLKRPPKKYAKRLKCFKEFNKNIKFSKYYINPFFILDNSYDYFVVGSDQVWNPNFFRLSDVDFLSFAKTNNKVALSASFGLNKLENHMKELPRKYLKDFKSISVREFEGEKIIKEIVPKKEVSTLIDPTMMLSKEKWLSLAKKPSYCRERKYILKYFLKDVAPSVDEEINNIAKKFDYDIIDILDNQSEYYLIGPSEFLYFEANASVICTDSYHSTIFSIIFDKPVIIFDRSDKDTNCINSRLKTLIEKLKLKDREYSGKITMDSLNHNYSEAYRFLEEEKKSYINFLNDAFDIGGQDGKKQ